MAKSKTLNATKRNRLVEAVKTNVRNNPTNIAAALQLSASQTRCTIAQANYVWYGKPNLRPNLTRGLRHSSAQFCIVSGGGIVTNVKSSKILKATKKTLLLDKNVDHMGDISTEEKVAFFDMVFK